MTPNPQSITTGAGKTLREIDVSRITHLGSMQSYSRIYQEDKSVTVASYTLKVWEKRLPGFIRVSQSALVNPAFIKELYVTKTGLERCRLRNGVLLPLPKGRVAGVRERLNK